MGTDIHCGLEKKVGKKWKFVKELDFWRNYDLFAVLADVRNGYGFAGCKTGEPIIPISKPKGLPPDIDKMTERVLSYEHSASYLYAHELLEYDWEQDIHKEGLMELGTKLDEYGQPESYCGGITNPNYIKHTWTIPLIRRMPIKLRALLKFLKTRQGEFRIVFDFDS